MGSSWTRTDRPYPRTRPIAWHKGFRSLGRPKCLRRDRQVGSQKIRRWRYRPASRVRASSCQSPLRLDRGLHPRIVAIARACRAGVLLAHMMQAFKVARVIFDLPALVGTDLFAPQTTDSRNTRRPSATAGAGDSRRLRWRIAKTKPCLGLRVKSASRTHLVQLKRKLAQALSRGCEDGIADTRPDQREGRFADPARRAAALDEAGFKLRRLGPRRPLAWSRGPGPRPCAAAHSPPRRTPAARPVGIIGLRQVI